MIHLMLFPKMYSKGVKLIKDLHDCIEAHDAMSYTPVVQSSAILSRFSEHMQLFHPEHADEILKSLGRGEAVPAVGQGGGVAGGGG